MHSDRLVLIRYHNNYNTSDPYYAYNPSENMNRIYYYGVDGNYTPHLWLDGTFDAGSNTGAWASNINSELNSVSPLIIDINGEYNRTVRNGHADIRIIATAAISYSNLKVRIGIIESNINRSSPNGTQIHNQTFRDMTPNTTGLPLTIAQGDTVNLTQSFSVPSPLVPANCEIVVFVQADTGHRILQGAKRNVMTMTYYLSPFNLISPHNNDTISICNPTCIWHRSVDVDSGYPVSYQAFISYTQDFNNPFVVSDTLSDTTWAVPLCLPNDTSYYWQVVAFNGHAENRPCALACKFTVNEPIGPGPFSLIYPPNYDTVRTCTTTCIWNHSVDANPENTVRYQVFLSYTPTFETPFIFSDTLSDTTWITPICLPNDTTYFWQVVAFNEFGQIRNSDSAYNFTVNEPEYIYTPGNVNGSGGFTGMDVVYAVAYLKGGPDPGYAAECPPGSGIIWYLEGDVNGSCSFTGLDVTYMVAFLKGGPDLVPCPNCQPGSR